MQLHAKATTTTEAIKSRISMPAGLKKTNTTTSIATLRSPARSGKAVALLYAIIVSCIFVATAEYTTKVWCALYMRIMDTRQWPWCDLGGEKKTDHDTHSNGHGHVRVFVGVYVAD